MGGGKFQNFSGLTGSKTPLQSDDAYQIHAEHWEISDFKESTDVVNIHLKTLR